MRRRRAEEADEEAVLEEKDAEADEADAEQE
jgi:hypothetical protein